MKATAAFSLLFMFAFAFAVGLIMTDQVSAIEECERSQCLCELYCSNYAGPACKFFPTRPYYLYEINCQTMPGENCSGCDQFDWGRVGCCRLLVP